jgi:hypothetical protein
MTSATPPASSSSTRSGCGCWGGAIDDRDVGVARPARLTRVERAQRYWWERRPYLLSLVLLGLVPLLWPALPPLDDLPGHMGRWHVSMAIGHSPALQRYYSFAWAPIGNLGMDLAVLPFASLFGLERGAKLAVMLIPLLTTIGMLWTAREAHGRVPPSAAIALPLAYAWPFQFGFVNFVLSQALALIAFALWLRLGRQGRLALRAALFAPIGGLLWLAHDFGWGLFGLMALGAELVRTRSRGLGWPRALAEAVFQCLPLALPALFMLLHPIQSARGNSTSDWFNMGAKLLWLLSIFRDRWIIVDVPTLAVALLALYVGARHKRMGLEPLLAIPALLCAIVFLLLPRLLLGGAYVDMRMAPIMLALALLAIRTPRQSTVLSRGVAIAALLFFAARTAATTVSYAILSAQDQQELAAIDPLPRGSAVLTLISRPCQRVWGSDRVNHISSMAIVRRDAFVNDQWVLEGQQLLRVRYGAAAPYLVDPSQLVYPADCPDIGSHFDQAIAGFNRRAFTHVWTIGFPPGAAHARDLSLIWTNGRSALYRVTVPPAGPAIG